MKQLTLLSLAALTVLVTGCPHNEYFIELHPRGNALDRKLVFYRVDGTNTNGVPNYQTFPSNELAAITALYPAGSVTQEGGRHFASGKFAGAMPDDVGGAGSYKHFDTSLGTAGYYVERFRGNDDFAARTRERLAAADQLTDLVIGWSRAELGREPGYKKLRRFLDGDFRRDLKNVAMYSWAAEISSSCKTNAGEEFLVRYGQYLVERGYVTVEDAPKLAQIFLGKNDSQARLQVQRLVAGKLGVPPSGPMPKSLEFLADPASTQKSWEKFLAGTKAYRAKLKQWEKEKQAKPDLQKPDPDEAAAELFWTLLQPGSGAEDDQLTVKLSLPSAPVHTNGRWDESARQVVWTAKLEEREKAARLPVFCCASWSGPDAEFQQAHFGRVILGGDELLKYCLWRSGLDDQQSQQWDSLLSGLRPGADLTKKVEAFQFSGLDHTSSSAADLGKELIKNALGQTP